MEDAPLPQHERRWRHPSELGPTPETLEVSSTRSRALAFSSGAVAAVLVAVMVVSITPRRSGSPSAISATTIPAASVQLRSQSAATVLRSGDSTTVDTVQLQQLSISSGRTVALVGAPTAISSAPAADPTKLDVASRLPSAETRVIVLTSSFTYDVAWGDLAGLIAPDGSIVITREGELLASFVGDELRLLVD